ncbi:MAG: HaeII family restriction endonuclease [Campylobacteraceae bacterium]|jgi:type II restriction enzyme|nr:HaeII family restriction endonuclease [Campylobacteraceae bacterium]
MSSQENKALLDKIIKKARVHLYKPIQIAEILYRDRVEQDIDLADISTYRVISKKWRDIICIKFLGRISTSSARYQDDIFNENAIPPNVLVKLGKENRIKNGIIEAYIYKKFAQRFTQMASALEYCIEHDKETFKLDEFISMFWSEQGLKRSIDKIYEIIVYVLFSTLIEALEVSVEVSLNTNKIDILREFEDFSKQVMRLSSEQTAVKLKARINRVGVTNAADRGLDMWANFGLAIQIKHLSLTEELAESITSSISADRIVIVCKKSEEKIIVSLLNQIGWKSKIQSIITEVNLLNWYEKALRGKFSNLLGDNILKRLNSEIQVEFPATNNKEFINFFHKRGYEQLSDDNWQA